MLYVSRINHSNPSTNLYICRFALLSIFKIFLALGLGACGGPPQTIDQGSETPALLAVTSTSQPNFGESLTGFSYTYTISIENLSRSVDAQFITAVGSLPAPFSYNGGSFPGNGGTCTSLLGPREACDLVFAINPTSTGVFTGPVSLDYFDGIDPQTLSFNLLTTTRNPIPATLAIAPAGITDFGVTAIGGFNEIPFTITNSGELDATAIVMSGLSGPFSIVADTCGTTIGAGASCGITLRFQPAAPAVYNQILGIAYNDGNGLQALNKSVTGEGRVAGFLDIDEGLTIDHGLINVGFFNQQTITLRNTGGGTASAIVFTPPPAPFYVDVNTCPATLLPAQSCSITMRFSPTATAFSAENLGINYFDGFASQGLPVAQQGQGFNQPLLLTMLFPASSPSNESTPTIRVGSTINGLGVRFYSDALCLNEIANGTAGGTSIDFSPVMPEGIYQFHARAEDDNGNLLGCSASAIDYQYDNTNPAAPAPVTYSVSYTSFATQSAPTQWASSASPDVVDYQIGVSANPAGGDDLGTFASLGNVTSGVHPALGLTDCNYYYSSVRAIDHVGLMSPYTVAATPFRFDAADPTQPIITDTAGDAATNNSATITWTPSTDNCGFSHYEVAISADLNNNGVLDPAEEENVIAYTNIGSVTTHRFNLLALTNGVGHFTQLRAVDTTNRYSPVSVSARWIVYDPSIELPNMIAWLDSNDPTTILDSSGRDALNPSFSGTIDDWLDKSGSAVNHHFNAVSAGSRPSYNAGNLSVTFDGTATGMTTPNHPEINTATVDQRNITVAFRTSGDITSRQVLYEEGGNIRGMNVYINGGQLYCGFYNDPTPTGGSNDPDIDQPFTWVSTPILPNTNYFVTWVFDYTHFTPPAGGTPGDLTCYLNRHANQWQGYTQTTSRLFAHSGAVGLGTVNGQSVFEDGSIPSSGRRFLGEIYEVMLFNNAPNSADVNNVHTYLNNKWN